MRFALAAFALLLLAGCLGDGPDAPAMVSDRLSEQPEAEPVSNNQTTDFGWAAAVAVPMTSFDVEFDASNGDARDLGKGVHQLVATITWTCDTPLCDLHAYLCSPDDVSALPTDQCALHMKGPSPIVLTADDPVAGTWAVHLNSDGPVVGVDGTIVMEESGAMEPSADA